MILGSYKQSASLWRSIAWYGKALRISLSHWTKRTAKKNTINTEKEHSKTVPILTNGSGTTLLDQSYLSIDRVLQIALFCLLLLLAIYAVVPGVAQELTPLEEPGLATRVVPLSSSFTLSDVSVEHAQGKGAWLLLASVATFLGGWLMGALGRCFLGLAF